VIKREWTVLFNQYDLRAVLEAQLNAVGDRVRALQSSAFASSTDVFLAAKIASGLVVEPLTLDEGRIQVSTRDTKIDVSHDFGRAQNPFGPTIVDGLEVTYHLPFSGDAQLLHCRPSTFTLNGARAVLSSSELRFPYDSPDRDVATTKRWFTEDLAKLKQWLGWVNEQVSGYNASILPAVQREVSARRMALDRTAADVKALGFAVRNENMGAPPTPLSPDEVRSHRTVRRRNARREYDVALSFAGEDRAYVEAVARTLVSIGVSVFYDRFEQVNLWGKDLADHLGQVYGHDARFTVIFASRHYAAKAWPNHEKSHALARHLRGDTGRILPVRFDDTEIPGIAGTIGYLDLRAINPDQLAELIRQKVDLGTIDA
jgi:hypothetical protein